MSPSYSGWLVLLSLLLLFVLLSLWGMTGSHRDRRGVGGHRGQSAPRTRILCTSNDSILKLWSLSLCSEILRTNRKINLSNGGSLSDISLVFRFLSSPNMEKPEFKKKILICVHEIKKSAPGFCLQLVYPWLLDLELGAHSNKQPTFPFLTCN